MSRGSEERQTKAVTKHRTPHSRVHHRQRKKLSLPPQPLFAVKIRYSPFVHRKARRPMAASSPLWPLTSGPRAIGQEVRYKQALCLLALRREKEADRNPSKVCYSTHLNWHNQKKTPFY